MCIEPCDQGRERTRLEKRMALAAKDDVSVRLGEDHVLRGGAAARVVRHVTQVRNRLLERVQEWRDRRFGVLVENQEVDPFDDFRVVEAERVHRRPHALDAADDHEGHTQPPLLPVRGCLTHRPTAHPSSAPGPPSLRRTRSFRSRPLFVGPRILHRGRARAPRRARPPVRMEVALRRDLPRGRRLAPRPA